MKARVTIIGVPGQLELRREARPEDRPAGRRPLRLHAERSVPRHQHRVGAARAGDGRARARDGRRGVVALRQLPPEQQPLQQADLRVAARDAPAGVGRQAAAETSRVGDRAGVQSVA